MHDTWKITADRVSGGADPVTIKGVSGRPATQESKALFQKKITRHHIINIQVLQNLWNAAVARRDRELFKVLGEWSAYPAPLLEVALASSTAPESFQKALCWNPFNIVLGPSTERRVGDPGEAFDNIQYQEFGAFDPEDKPAKRENLARQEFNQHVERSTRINALMGPYIGGGEPEQIRNSLVLLLRSDRPSQYPNLFAVMRAKANLKSPAYNEELDTRLSAAHENRRQEYSPDKLPGCLMDPSLWRNVEIAAPGTFESADHADVHKGRLQNKVVPWVSQSYLPQTMIAPVSQHRGILSPAEFTRIGGTPAQTIGLGGTGRALMERSACRGLIETAVRKTGPLAKTKGILLYVVGPNQQGVWQDVVSNVAAASQTLADQGNKIEVKPVYHPSYSQVEVRIHFKN